MPGEFTDKVVVVTGASRGIGRGVAQSFAAEGGRVVIAASSPANLAAGAAQIETATGVKPVTFPADLRTAAGCEGLFHFVETAFGRCDVLVNSAGATKAGNFLTLDDATWQDGFDLKFFACVRLCRWFWPMLKEAQGSIVNVDGGAARTPNPEFLIGGSVNAAMANFSKGLSQLGKRDGVNVNVIHPGSTETERSNDLLRQRAAAQSLAPEDLRAKELAARGQRRIGQPEDIGALAVFLCSQRARHIQGVQIAVDGGDTPGLY